MGLAGAWVLFPLLLTLIATGWGLLVEQAAGTRVPGALLPAIGIAALAALLTISSNIAPDVNLALVAAGAAAGLGLCATGTAPRPEGLRSLRPTAIGTAVALGAFALYAAPIVLTGSTAVSGYIRLDDTTSLLALGEWVFSNGRSTASLAPSTYEAVLQLNLAGTRYPVGAMLPLVAAGKLSGQELMGLWMPFMALLSAMTALAIEVILRPVVTDRRVRGLVAVLAAGSALLFGYALWGGLKEVMTATLVTTNAALIPGLVAASRDRSLVTVFRSLIPVAVVSAGIAAALSAAGIVWVVPTLVIFAIGALIARGRGSQIPIAVVGVLAVGAVAGLLVRRLSFVEELTRSRPSESDLLGNLIEPLHLAQVLGIWPAEDFRVDPVAPALTAALLVAVAAGAAWALRRAVSGRQWGVLAYGGVLASAAGILLISEWPWVEAKALAIAAPVPLALAGAAVGDLLASRSTKRIAGWTLLAAIVVGVLWSDALAFRGTTLTPHDRHAEMVDINERFAGRGPAMVTEYDPYVTRWYLRDLDPEGASELRRRRVQLTTGDVVGKGGTADIDAFALDGLNDYRLIVTRRSPLTSRPSSAFARVWRGRWYDVWERTASRRVIEHLPLGNDFDPGGVAPCADVRRLAATAGPNGTLIAAVPRQPAVVGLDSAGASPGWLVASAGSLTPPGGGDGTVRTKVTVPRAGRYEVWLGGGVRGGAEASIDGRKVGDLRHELGYAGQWLPFGTADLAAGTRELAVKLQSGLLHPGTDGVDVFPIGPVALVAQDEAQELFEVPAGQSSGLCRQKLDWIEAVG